MTLLARMCLANRASVVVQSCNGLCSGHIVDVMKKPSLGCAILISLALLSLARQGRAANPPGEQLLNGNFESFTDGLPNDWDYDQEGVGPATLQSSTFYESFHRRLPGRQLFHFAGQYADCIPGSCDVSILHRI
jgi:hypothetical protein